MHRSRFLLLSVCAFAVLLVLPGFARSQEVSEQDSSGTAELQSTTTPAEAVSAAAPYVIEGIPGGDRVVGDFVVGPGKIDVTLAPGETQVIEMTVTNRTGERRLFNLTTEDATGSNDPETPIVLLGADRGPYSLKDYISVPNAHFELGHNERARVPVTISIPKNAEPGGLYGSVLVDTVAIKADSGETTNTVPQSAIVARIGTLFFVTIPGDVEREGKLVDFGTLPKKTFYGSGPITFGILYENTGSIHLAPRGELRIRNILGEEVGAVPLEPWFVLPQSTRLRELSWDREVLFGRYTATVDINRSYDEIVDTASFTFWVLPWKLVATAFAALFIVIFLIRTFFRTFEFKRKR